MSYLHFGQQDLNMRLLNLSSLLLLAVLNCIFSSLPAQTAPAPPPLPEREIQRLTELPVFPGCENLPDFQERRSCSVELLLAMVVSEIQYPSAAVRDSIEGKAVIAFTVKINGQMDDLRLIKDPGGGCGAEVMRVMQLLIDRRIRWIPRSARFRPIEVDFVLPVVFRLSGQD